MTVIGVDGCARGWVGIVLGGDPARPTVRAVAAPHFADVVAQVPNARVVAVDMPVGLCETGVRAADVAARALLGHRWATVFLAPVRSAVDAATYDEANRRHREATGSGLSRQSWGLATKITEVEAWRTGSGQAALEVHPEMAFVTLAGAPLSTGKKTWAGATERRRLLAGAGIVVPEDLGPAGRLAGVDDVLDAAVVAWSAQRIAAGRARSLPDPPELDHLGRPMAIWA